MRDRAAAFAREEVAPRAAAMAEEGPFPRWIFETAGPRGLLGLLAPTGLGGAGASLADVAEAVELVARECGSTSVVLDVHVTVATEPLLRFGSAEQLARYVPRLASGEWVAAFALSEPGSGSDAAGMATRAERTAGGWRLDGAKAWITNSGGADLYLVFARTGEAGAHGISAFLVEAAWPGVRPERPLRKLGMRGSWTAGLVLDGVQVPAGNLLGEEGGGFAIAMSALDGGRVGISAQAVGIAEGALRTAASHLVAGGLGVAVHDVVESGGEAGEGAAARLPAAAARLAGMAARVAQARALYRHAAATRDAGLPYSREAAIAKLVATDACVEVAAEAVDLCGPRAADDLHPATIRLRDAKACQIYEGTNQVQRIVIARSVLR